MSYIYDKIIKHDENITPACPNNHAVMTLLTTLIHIYIELYRVRWMQGVYVYTGPCIICIS